MCSVLEAKTTCRRSNEALARRADRRFTAGPYIQFDQDGPDMFGSGTRTDEELLGNFPIGLAVDQEA